jgi:hypothetical protein
MLALNRLACYTPHDLARRLKLYPRTVMKIPVFVSCPTDLSERQKLSHKLILRELERANLEPRTLGRDDYPTELPLREVLMLARHCSGAVILGFEQLLVEAGVTKRETPKSEIIKSSIPIPTPWNHLEAGILFSLSIPLLVFREDGIQGGVFDPGVSDVFIHRMPQAPMSPANKKALSGVFQKWQASVRTHYYE